MARESSGESVSISPWAGIGHRSVIVAENVGAASAGKSSSGAGSGPQGASRAEYALHVPAEGVGGREHLSGVAHRQQAVAIHRFHQDRQLSRRCRLNGRHHEGGVVVGDDHARRCRERPQQALTCAGRLFNPRQVGDSRATRERALVVGHPVEHEAMESIAGPLVVQPERLEYHQRPAQLARPLNRALQAKVVSRPARGDHPVKNPGAERVWRRLVDQSDAGRGNAGRHSILPILRGPGESGRPPKPPGLYGILHRDALAGRTPSKEPDFVYPRIFRGAHA